MKQSGMALVEALVAASLLSLGLLGASRLTLRALDAALQTRQLEQAHALAREALDCALRQTSPCPAAAHPRAEHAAAPGKRPPQSFSRSALTPIRRTLTASSVLIRRAGPSRGL